jgi:glycosyltransferase involved in cell wall biosynthesis
LVVRKSVKRTGRLLLKKPLEPMKKRVLFVTRTQVFGGTERHLADLIARLDRTRYEPVILCLGRDVFGHVLQQRHDLFARIEIASDSRSFITYWRTFLRLKAQVIVFVNGQLGLFAWYAYLAAKLSGAVRVFAIEHLIADAPPPHRADGGYIGGLRKLLGWRARFMLKMRIPAYLSRRTICVSDAVRNRLVKDFGFPARKTLTVRNGIDISYYGASAQESNVVHTALNIGTEDDIILCIASLVRQKRIDILLSSFAEVVERHPSCKLIILGDGPLKAQHIEQSNRLGLESSVFFVGYQQDVRPYLAESDIFVLSSEKEGLPLSILEAMAFGLPCIATNVGGNSEAITDGATGLIVLPGSAELLADAIHYLLEHKEERAIMGDNGRQRVKQLFTIDGAMNKVIEVLAS